ncbi:isoaspartyl peptidase/L-asparaginase family protein [Schleiferia thermophila]|jgi:beta-aspartyl-peptidase (threonine type)|uniref:isoaspartyl peptidase/L-asparaginase family protein n=1 Tax=Schleiferia thermophila TaxID=884107 RepID=UPI0004E64F64|nr:isoaspartyl peptidase/L-asparaginase [Schleiferia thermophila]KFD40121.1 asparaginase [Schleiferia thermophila str. Yellowstone]PMB28398.1 isoaspartyl peptidase/L-asparaginase [Fischerella thermalis CCMEE 5319]
MKISKTLVVFSYYVISLMPILAQNKPFGLVIHGGAGDFNLRKNPELAEVYRASLRHALDSGYRMLTNGHKAEDVVVAVIEILENDTLFNAGKGAVLTKEGHAELDASIMTGHDLAAGAVCGVRYIKNPIKAAQLVKNRSSHVLLSGPGAERFAFSNGLDSVANDFFITEKNKKRWLELKESEKFGTVGCVVLDQWGNLAAGTSTGGMMFKKFGRVGDAPIIGAGTYAQNEVIAISCTGHGEFFIRQVAAYQVAARIMYKKQAPAKAIQQTLATIKKLGGTGGMIAIDPKGRLYSDFTTNGMFRAGKNSLGNYFVKIHEE